MIYFISTNKTIFDPNYHEEPMISFYCGGVVDDEEIYEGTFYDMIMFLSDIENIEVDTETINDRVVLIQLGNLEHQYVLEWDTLTQQEKTVIKLILESTKKRKLLQNAKYDYRIMLKEGIRIQNIYDTMLVECVINCGYEDVGYGLNVMGQRYLGISFDKSVRGEIDTAGITKTVIRYASRDVKHLGQIRDKQLEMVDKYDLHRVVELENNVVKAFAEMESNRILVLKNKWTELDKKVRNNLVEFEEELNKDLVAIPNMLKELFGDGKRSVGYGLFAEVTTNINYNSHEQIAKIVKGLANCYKEPKLKALTTTSEKELAKFKVKIPFLRKFIDYKKKQKEKSTYGLKFIKEHLDADDRISTDFWQILNTGRVSSNNPNLQNLPKDTEHRNCFVADEGYLIADGDYSSQELALIAEDSGEEVWINAIKNNWDLHSSVAEVVFGKEWIEGTEADCAYYHAYTDKKGNSFPAGSKHKCDCKKHKKLRDSIKTVNYCLAYGGSAYKVSSILNIEVKEAEKIIQTYFKAVPKLKKHFDTLATFGIQHLMIRSFKPFRRIRFFTPPLEGKDVGAIQRQAMNTRFQATGADMCKQALVYLYDYIFQNNLWDKVKFMLQIHDSLMFQVREDYAEEWIIIQKELMIKVNELVLNKIVVGVDIKLSKCWQK